MRHRKLAAAVLIALTAGTVPLVHAAAKHAPQQAATNAAEPAYLNGGVGKDDAARMHAAAKDYSLQIQFSERRDDEFIADAAVKIADAHGTTVFERSDVGPILLVRLAPGKYRVTATADGRSETRTATIAAHGTTDVSFHWNGMAKAAHGKTAS